MPSFLQFNRQFFDNKGPSTIYSFARFFSIGFNIDNQETIVTELSTSSINKRRYFIYILRRRPITVITIGIGVWRRPINLFDRFRRKRQNSFCSIYTFNNIFFIIPFHSPHAQFLMLRVHNNHY